MIYYFESMKIEDIEKACKLNKEQKEINEILELKNFVDTTLSSPILMLFHNNERYNLTPLLTREAKIQILDIIFSDCEERARQIKQEIEEL